MGLGAGCRKAKFITDASIGGIVNVLILVVTPCLVIDCFQRPFDPSTLGSLSLAFGICVAVHLVAVALAYLLVRHKAAGTRKVMQLSTVFSNAGFMGIPLEQAVLGDAGVFYGIVYVVTFNLVIWSWGYWVMGGRPRLRMLLVNPGTIGIALGLPLFLLSIRLPEVLGTPVKLMSGLNTPLAMIVIGYGLAGARLGPVVRMPSAYVATALRLLACPLLLIAALHPFHAQLERPMTLALVTAASAPVAAMVSMFATRFGRDVDASVGMVSGTTLLSAVTMPAVIALAMRFL